jgi:RimJ/RimL family protein N-acetyltransferase
MRQEFAERGFCFWAVEIPDVTRFAGFIGLNVPSWTPFQCVEIGWRLAAAFWGKGYATEGATAALTFGLGPLGLEEIVAITTESNRPSRRVMEKLRMTHNPADDFDDADLPHGHPLRRMVVYKIRATGSPR